MSKDTEHAKAALEQSHHELREPMQAILLNQDEIREVMEEQSRKLGKLERAVLGDQEYFQEGILPTLANHEKRIRSLENWRVYVLAAMATLAVIWNIVKPFFPKL